MVLKIISKEYRAGVPSTATANSTSTSSSMLARGVKLSYVVGDVLTTLSGTEARVPLQYHELQEVRIVKHSLSAHFPPLL